GRGRGDGRAVLRGGAAPTPRRVAAAGGGRRGPTVSGRAYRGRAPRSRPIGPRRGGSLFSPGSHHCPWTAGQIAGTASRDESDTPVPKARLPGRSPAAARRVLRLVHRRVRYP